MCDVVCYARMENYSVVYCGATGSLEELDGVRWGWLACGGVLKKKHTLM